MLTQVKTKRVSVDGSAKRDAERPLLGGTVVKLRFPQTWSFDFAEPPSVDLVVAEAPPRLDGARVRTLLAERLGGAIETWFRALSDVGIGTSSGQVHRATLHDGREVAVKLLLSGGDARVEASTLRDFTSASHELGVRVPGVVESLTRRDVLVMDWCGGEPFVAVRGWSAVERRALASTLLRFVFGSMFGVGRVHVDPHPRNLRFSRGSAGPEVAVLDFGAVLTLEPGVRRALMHLVAARLGVLSLSSDDAFTLWRELGFDLAVLEAVKARLPRLGEILFAPLASTWGFETRTWRPAEALNSLLGEDRWSARAVVPPSLLPLLRTFRGLLSYLDALDAPVPWRPIVVDALNRATPVARPTPVPARPAGREAQSLRIRLTEEGETRVELLFRAQVTPVLRELVPAGVLPMFERRGLDVDAVARAAVEAGLPRGELFGGEEGTTQVRIWLE